MLQMNGDTADAGPIQVQNQQAWADTGTGTARYLKLCPGLLYRHSSVHPVLVEEVDAVNSQPLQRPLYSFSHIRPISPNSHPLRNYIPCYTGHKEAQSIHPLNSCKEPFTASLTYALSPLFRIPCTMTSLAIQVR